MTNATSFRFSETTARQLAWLAPRFSGNQTTVVTVAIDRMYQQERSTMSNETSAYDRAVARVNETPELEQYYDLLIEYDWPEGDEHYTWVATADVAELIDWAQTVRQDEDAD